MAGGANVVVTRATINDMVARIAERFHPRRVILFGSHARGQATEHSDVDLLVVVDRPGPRGRRSAPIIRMLAEEFDLPVDVIVRSHEAIEEWQHVPGTLCRKIAEEGVVLYDEGE